VNRNHTITNHLGELLSSSMIDVEWHEVRRERDAALKDSDWRAVKDRVLPTAWKDYRQALLAGGAR